MFFSLNIIVVIFLPLSLAYMRTGTCADKSGAKVLFFYEIHKLLLHKKTKYQYFAIYN